MEVNSKLSTFHSLCQQIESNSSLTVKQEIIAGFLARFKGDVGLLFKHLLPKFNGRLYHLQDKQLVKLLAPLLKVPEVKLMQHVKNSGCIAKSVQHFFRPAHPGLANESTLCLEDLDTTLNELSTCTTEDPQRRVLTKFLGSAAPNDVFILLRQVKQDLRLGAGIRVILAGLHPAATAIYKQCADVQKVVRRVLGGETDVGDDADGADGASGASRSPSPAGGRLRGDALAASIAINTPMSPMLAAPSKGIDHVLSKCPNGAYSETKYDGERIQIHKDGTSWRFFARSLKPMKPDKYEGLDAYLRKAVRADSCILDGEILLVDLRTSKPLPFGTLGKHKKAMFKEACTCIFLFDIMFINGASVLAEPLDVRRALLAKAVDFVPNRIMLSEMRPIVGSPDQRVKALRQHLAYAIMEGLEGLVCKDLKSTYAPGGRYWIKLKKDYLEGMADSADLVVLGAFYGSGNKGGVLSTFLMGVWDKTIPCGGTKQFKTVCKVGNGHDDATLEALNKRFKDFVVPCSAPPTWIDVHNSHRPDVYVKDPMASDVWEIIGAEFSKTVTHTAAGVSLRFPRVKKIRDDKDANTATSLQELLKLVSASRERFEKKGMELDESGADDDYVNGGAAAAAARAPMVSASASAVQRAAELFDDTAASRQTAVSDGEMPLPSKVVRAPTASPYVRVSQEAPAEATNKAGDSQGTYREVAGDAAQPLIAPSNLTANIVIAHSVSQNGRWSNRGVMGSISKYVGDEPQDEYNKMASLLQHGNVQFVEVSNRMSPAKMYVATLVAQDSSKRHQVIPEIFLKTLEKCCAFCAKHNAVLHLSRPDASVCPTWAAAAAYLREATARTGIDVVVYDRTLMRQGSVVQPSTTGPSAPRASASAGHDSPASPPLRKAGTVDFNDEVMSAVALHIIGLAARDTQAVRQKALMMGARIVDDVGSATHVVAGSTEIGECGKRCVVSRSWIDESFASNRLLDPAPFLVGVSRAQGPPERSGTGGGSGVFDAMKGSSVVVNGFSEAPRRELENKIKMMGGTVQDKWKMLGVGRSTHMVTASLDAAARKTVELGGTVLTRAWVDDTLHAGILQPIHKYLFSPASGLGGERQQSVDEALGLKRTRQSSQSPDRNVRTPILRSPQPHRTAFNQHSRAPNEESRSVASSSSSTQLEDEHTIKPGNIDTVLSGMKFVVEGYGLADTQEIRNKLEKMGGQVISPSQVEASNVIVSDTLTTLTYRLKDKKRCVTRKWVNATFTQGKMLPLEQHAYFGRIAQAADNESHHHPAPSPKRQQAPSAHSTTSTESFRGGDDDASFPDADTPTDVDLPTASYHSPSSTETEPDSPAGTPERKAMRGDVAPALPPAVMAGVRIAIAARDESARHALQRYHIAFGGDVVPLQAEAVEQRHLGTSPSTSSVIVIAQSHEDARSALRVMTQASQGSQLRSAPLVSKDWLYACIREGRVLPTSPFTFTLQK